MRRWYAVIMAGGLGQRLQPLTGRHLPKPLLPLKGGRTLLSATLARTRPLVGTKRIWVVTTTAFAARIRQGLPAGSRQQLISEPAMRGTATCIALMTSWLARQDAQAGILVLPADHWIAPARRFITTLRQAMRHAHTHPETLVCVGIPPTQPSSDYGYLRHRRRRVAQFIEKPPRHRAQALVRRGQVLWNAGMFVGTVHAFRTALERHAPRLVQTIERALSQSRDGSMRGLTRLYHRLPVTSFDRAVMERYAHVDVVPARFHWCDVGSWAAWPVLRTILDVERLALPR